MEIIKIIDDKPIIIKPDNFQKGDIVLITIKKIYLDEDFKRKLQQKGIIEI